MPNRLAPAREPNEQPISVAALLNQPNPWSDWMERDAVVPLSPLPFMALLLRELPVEWMVDRLAPALIAADRDAQQRLNRYLVAHPLPPAATFGFEHWLAWWDGGGDQPYEAALRDVLRAMPATPDLRFFATTVAGDALDRSSVLWFLLNAIRHWVDTEGDPEDVDEAARWLPAILAGHERGRDSLGLLFGHLYERHRAGRSPAWRTLPDDLAHDIDPDPIWDLSRTIVPGEAGLLLKAASPISAPTLTLTNLLGGDARAWPQAGSAIGRLRSNGLMTSTSLALTRAGQATADLDGDQPSPFFDDDGRPITPRRH